MPASVPTPPIAIPIDRQNTASIKWDKYRNQPIIPMWVADMDFPIAEEIMDALRQRLEHPIIGYTHAPDDLNETVVHALWERFGWRVEAEWISWMPGVLPGLTAACGMLGETGDQILVPTPVYHPLLHIPVKLQRQRIDSAMQRAKGRWTIDFDLLAKQAASGKVSSMLLSNPHNPAGTVFSREELGQIVEICARNNICVISDEIHCDLVLKEGLAHTPTALAGADISERIITLMSPSKTFNLAGANASFSIISDSQLREQFRAACHYAVPIVPTLSYVAALAAYGQGWPWHKRLIEQLRTNQRQVQTSINAIPGMWMDDTEATYLAWINTAELPVENAFTFFEQAGVGMSPGAQFGDDNFQRLNFACHPDTLEAALQRIRSAVLELA